MTFNDLGLTVKELETILTELRNDYNFSDWSVLFLDDLSSKMNRF